MNKKILMTAILIAASVSVGAIAAANETESGNNASARDDRMPEAKTQGASLLQTDAPKLSAILFVNSLSCKCTLERCKSAEAIMEGIKKEYKDIVTFETIDYELQHEKARALIDRFKVFMIPTLVLLDSEKRVVWRCMDFSKEEPIRSKFKKFAGRTRDADASD
ncbi:MAG: thioredoxin family protein [Candidatus Hydrogenedentota bacterium]|nr:MAG: thioredoxin family protein [Candidatus Hydrogenedentota bacterium]